MSHETSIQLLHLLQDRIFICTKISNKQTLLKQLVWAVCQSEPLLSVRPILAQILAREKQISTTLDTGLALPHIRVEGLERVVAALAILPCLLVEGKGRGVKAVFLFLSPARSEFFQIHLQVLALLAKTFTPAFLQRLSQCSEVNQIKELLQAKSSDVK